MEQPITLKCDKCNHIEIYENEIDLFQDSKMWGLPNNKVLCDECLNEETK
jgi:hypothetical protein